MWRHMWLIVVLLNAFSFFGCSFDNTPRRLAAYLPQSSVQTGVPAKMMTQAEEVISALVVLNDAGFEKSAPELRRGTLENLGEHLKTEIQKQLPVQFTSVVYPDDLQPNGSADQLIQLAKEQSVPYLLLAVLSSSEWEVFDRLPMASNLGGGGMRSMGLNGYRAENYARVELALIDGQTGQPVMTTDGQAWATLERLAVPLESNIYPVVRRAQTQPPIYPNSEDEAYETLRWVSGQDAIAQAVMHFEDLWRKHQST
ncbi:MAG: hypothetical protein KC592_17215 [Nitrospira sp.]|nr:hypothetical protein [Nitrospira sp.]HBP90812.1 hypothetical protein [Nitrospiraceae bacterium]HNP29589.1 hypothetical protein [Nitrospirales bacterium]